ncbi:MAG: hypothetical protein OXC72_03715, partial [Roseovarius sp.]|nr:hypothetical protein [Roseovarius sp.]
MLKGKHALVTGSGTASSGGFGALRGGAFFDAFSMRCRMIPTSSARLRTARLSRRTGRRPAQGGTSKRGIGPLRRGFDGQDSGGRGRA